MSSLGAIVVAGSGHQTARTLDCLARQRDRIDQTTLVLPPGLDRRVTAWLEATASARSWTLVTSPGTMPGAMLNAGRAASTAEWLVILNPGDVLLPPTRGALEVAVASLGASAAAIFGRARLVGVGVDETVSPDEVDDVVALDPGHPILRSVCWKRDALDQIGGFDADLAGAILYDVWLRLLAASWKVGTISHTLVELNVDPAESLPTELDSSEYRSAVRAVSRKHAVLLSERVVDVLERRAARVSALGPRHLAVLERHQVPQDSSAPPPVAEGLPKRPSPLSRNWGYERGGPIDRVYIERFMRERSADIRGVVLEVQEADYTHRFGGAAVLRSDVVDLAESNPNATVVTDLRSAANIATATYDCVILTQTLHVISQMTDVVAECHRILKPGGVLLVTLPCLSRVCLEYGRDGDFWRVTPAGARQLFEAAFGDGVSVTVFGNALAGAAFALGLGIGEVDERDLSVTDIFNPTLVGVRAVKAGQPRAPSVATANEDRGLVLLYHRVGGRGPDPHRINLNLAAFEQQMAWLASACAVLPLAEFVARAYQRRLPPRAVALTFDDGYLDTLTQAAPILKTHSLAATCFVATDGLPASHAFWWDRLAALLLGDGDRPEALTATLPGGPRRLTTATRGERLFAHGVIYHAVVGLAVRERERVLAQLAEWAPDTELDPDCRRMTADELRALIHHGVALGAHTVTHPQLPMLDHTAQISEMAQSRAILESLTGGAVPYLAYPFGAFDDGTIASAEEAGLTHAFTCEPRVMASSDPPLRLPRLDPQEPRLDRFMQRVEHCLAARA